MASCHQGGCIHFVEKTKEEGLLFFSEATLRLLCSLLLYVTDPWAIFARSLCRSTDLSKKKATPRCYYTQIADNTNKGVLLQTFFNN